MRRFFDACYAAENMFENASVFKGTNFENGLRRCIHGLTRADQEHLVKFLHLTLNKLIKIMIRPPIQESHLSNYYNIKRDDFSIITYINYIKCCYYIISCC